MMQTYDRQQTKRFAFFGILGGLICSVADYFLEFLGQESIALGQYGVTESAWQYMAPWRFTASIWLVCLAVPMYALGLIAIGRQMRATHPKLGKAFTASAMTGALGALFIHIMLCMLPVVYQFLFNYASQGMAVQTVDAMVNSFLIPFVLYYVLLIFIPAVLWCVYAFQKNAAYPMWESLGVIGFTLVCLLLAQVIPALEWLGVGSISRMIALWSFVAWRAEGRQ